MIGFDKDAQFLIKRKANVNIVGKYGNTALMLAASKGTEQNEFILCIKHRLIHRCIDWLPCVLLDQTYYSFYIGKEQIVRALLDKKASKDAVNNDGLTAFMLAAKKGRMNILNLPTLIYIYTIFFPRTYQ